MDRESDFRMQINEMFHFNNGRTVLVGLVETGPTYIPAQPCEILMDGIRRQLIRIEGEMLPSNAGQEERSVSTTDKLVIDRSDLKRHAILLQAATGEDIPQVAWANRSGPTTNTETIRRAVKHR